MKLYTRTGDTGTTSLADGRRVSKTDPRVEAYGTLDELTAHVGLLYDQLPSGWSDLREPLLEIIHRLMDCAAISAGADTLSVGPEAVAELEQWSDQWTEGIPALRHFTLPCGHPLVSQSHVARTVCRRAERRLLEAGLQGELSTYINRLSDTLYALSRILEKRCEITPHEWLPKIK